ETHFAAAVRLDPDYKEARYNLGVVLELEGRLDEAAQSFSLVLEGNPSDLNARFHLGLIKKRQGKLEEALANFSHLAKLQPDDADVRLNLVECRKDLADAYAEAGDFDRAIATARQALDLTTNATLSNLARQIQERIQVYKKKKPVR